MSNVTRRHAAQVMAMLERGPLSPTEIATALGMELDTVLSRLAKPCTCGTEGCLTIRRPGEKSSHFQTRTTSGSAGCLAITRTRRHRGPKPEVEERPVRVAAAQGTIGDEASSRAASDPLLAALMRVHPIACLGVDA